MEGEDARFDAEFRSTTYLSNGDCKKIDGVKACWDAGSRILQVTGTDNADDIYVNQIKDWAAREVIERVVINDGDKFEVSVDMMAFDGVDHSVDPLATRYIEVHVRAHKGHDYILFEQHHWNTDAVGWYTGGWHTGIGDSSTHPSGTAYGQGGDDTIEGAVYAEGGDDRDTIYGTWWGDTLKGNDSGDHIYGLEGNDYLYGNGGTRDKLYGNEGNDHLDTGSLDPDLAYLLVCDGGYDDDFQDVDVCKCANVTTECPTSLAHPLGLLARPRLFHRRLRLPPLRRPHAGRSHRHRPRRDRRCPWPPRSSPPPTRSARPDSPLRLTD